LQKSMNVWAIDEYRNLFSLPLDEKVPQVFNLLMKNFTSQEVQVLQMCFGLVGVQKRNLRQIGGVMNLTSARIAQIRDKALRKLRHPVNTRKLKPLRLPQEAFDAYWGKELEPPVPVEPQDIRHQLNNLKKPIEELELSVRATNSLRMTDIETVFELVQYTESGLLQFHTMGEKSAREIDSVVERMGLYLGMDFTFMVPGTEISLATYLEYLNQSVEEMPLSIRARNCLKVVEIETVYDLVLRSESELLQFHNFGQKSADEIKRVLADMGLRFSTPVWGRRESLKLA
jgi:hypothetical protein